MRSVVWTFALLVGAGCNQAPMGEPGSAGLPGEKGEKGDRGDKGEKGDRGDKGEAGPPGSPGAAGPTGLAGPAGMTGAAGPMGPAGPMGAMGPIGPAGPKGDPGMTGTAGPMGPPGAAGPSGAAGAAGAKGDPGPQGPPGPSGSGAYSEELGTFAGFTATTYTGAISGGRPGAHALCAAAFPGAHLCHASEYIQSESATTVPMSGAWVDPSTLDGDYTRMGGMPGSGRHVFGSSCSSWSTAATASTGFWITTSGTISSAGDCSASRAVACCQ